MNGLMVVSTLLLGGYLFVDTYKLNKARRSIPHVIHVNGIRGKSSVVWMLDAVCRGAGYKTFSKVTGTNPEYRDVNGQRIPIRRLRGARIHEQNQMILRAAKQNAEVVILECMAVNPIYQRKSSEFIDADLTIITNVKLDHTEALGLNRQEIAVSLSESIVKAKKRTKTKDKKLLLGESSQRDVFKKKCDLLKVELSESFDDPKEIDFNDSPYLRREHPENLRTVLSAAAHLGISLETAMQNIQYRERDALSTQKIAMGNGYLYAGYTINDFDSTLHYYEAVMEDLKLQAKEDLKLAVHFNDRVDRPYRKKLFLKWLTIKNVESIYLSGASKHANRSSLRKFGYEGDIIFINGLGEINFDQGVVIGIGNIKGLSEELLEADHA